MAGFFAAIGRFSVRFRFIVALAWIVVTIVSVRAFPSLASVSKDNNSGFLPANSPSMQASNLAAVFQNTDLVPSIIVAARPTGPMTAADQAAVDRLIPMVKALPNVKVVRDNGISPDGSARQVEVLANVSFNGTGRASQLVKDVRHAFSTVGAPPGLQLHLTGELPTAVDSQAQAGSSRNATQGLSFIFIILLLLVAFRALLAPLVTLVPAALVLTLSGPVIAASTHLGVQVSSITQVILIVLILGAGTDYGLFLVFRVREELRRGLAPHDAVVRAVTKVGETISFSAFTVIAALLSLLLADFGFYQGLGPALAIGIGLMLLAGLTFLPAVLAIFGRAVFWPTRVSDMGGERAGVWGRVAAGAARRPAATVLIGITFLVALALGNVGIGNTGFADVSSGPSGSDSAAGQSALTAHFPGLSTSPSAVLFRFDQPIWSHPATLDAVQARLRTVPEFAGVVGPLTPNGINLGSARLSALHRQLGPAARLPRQEPAGLSVPPQAYNAYRATAQFISADSRTVQWFAVLKNNSTGDAKAVDQTPAIRDRISAIGRSVGANASGLYGVLAFAYDVNHISTADLIRIIPVVTIIIALLLALVLRSAVAPLYLVASVVLSYLAALGFAAIVFVRLGPDSGINFVLPFLVFIFLMALGSDYNILVMTRIREEAHQMPLRRAVPHAIGVSGTTVTTAGMILAGSFAVLAVAAGNQPGADQVRQIGYGIAAGVLMDTFLIRTLLVPSMVVLLGRWNWWPSPLFRAAEPVDDRMGAAERSA